MKRFNYFLTIMLMAAMPMLFTSCDDPYYDDWYDRYNWYDTPYYDASDDAIDLAQMLNGTWSGQIINEYTNKYGQREQTQCYADFTFTQYRSDAINGTGIETDYDQNNNASVNRFKWYVDQRTGNVYIEYTASGYRYLLDSRGNSKYSGFSLYKNTFNGVMEGVNNDEYVFFTLDRSYGRNAQKKDITKNTTKSFGNGNGQQYEKSDVPVMIRKR